MDQKLAVKMCNRYREKHEKYKDVSRDAITEGVWIGLRIRGHTPSSVDENRRLGGLNFLW